MNESGVNLMLAIISLYESSTDLVFLLPLSMSSSSTNSFKTSFGDKQTLAPTELDCVESIRKREVKNSYLISSHFKVTNEEKPWPIRQNITTILSIRYFPYLDIVKIIYCNLNVFRIET